MGTGYLIDSNVVIDYLNGKLPESGRLFMHRVVNETPNLSVIIKIEVLGFNYDQDSNHLVFDFLENSTIFELTKEIVDATIQIRKQTRIKIPDAIIAATALVLILHCSPEILPISKMW